MACTSGDGFQASNCCFCFSDNWYFSPFSIYYISIPYLLRFVVSVDWSSCIASFASAAEYRKTWNGGGSGIYN